MGTEIYYVPVYIIYTMISLESTIYLFYRFAPYNLHSTFYYRFTPYNLFYTPPFYGIYTL